MSKELKVTIAFWGMFALSPIMIILIDMLIYPILSGRHLMSQSIVSALPVWVLVGVISMTIINYLTVGRLTKRQFNNQPITANWIDWTTLGSACLMGIIILAAILVKLILNDKYGLDYILNDLSLLIFPLLAWLTYKAWREQNQNWIFIGLIIQTLFTTLFAEWFAD
ncbi:hypothetical protein [Lentilactobacillus kisonensis]|uniref:Uncharacterized protein n=2 Tax=Lentilactobacillus kisonensis TaxID=481722 RepID=H1LHH9_9LACO|nr:hypothetical protein [Lentilactobacillus kisonensis]EHO50330.1 hypothetical protein HMPREF9104_02070 [Lentilactobacillus kisonensis F0435]